MTHREFCNAVKLEPSGCVGFIRRMLGYTQPIGPGRFVQWSVYVCTGCGLVIEVNEHGHPGKPYPFLIHARKQR